MRSNTHRKADGSGSQPKIVRKALPFPLPIRAPAFPPPNAAVLERFVRLEESRNSPGTGLGLSLVAAVARMHEARLELADNGPGLKATLIFPAETQMAARKTP